MTAEWKEHKSKIGEEVSVFTSDIFKFIGDS